MRDAVLLPTVLRRPELALAVRAELFQQLDNRVLSPAGCFRAIVSQGLL